MLQKKTKGIYPLTIWVYAFSFTRIYVLAFSTIRFYIHDYSILHSRLFDSAFTTISHILNDNTHSKLLISVKIRVYLSILGVSYTTKVLNECGAVFTFKYFLPILTDSEDAWSVKLPTVTMYCPALLRNTTTGVLL